MLFRYWNNTVCINYDNIDFLEEAIIKLLQQEEGCYRIHQLPKLDFNTKQLRIKPWKKLPNLWIIVLFQTQSGWTVIKTFPKGLFCRRALGSDHPRLLDLTKRLNCKSFYLEVHHNNSEFLLEANAKGNTIVSGCPGAEVSEDIKLYEEQVDLSGLIQKFSLIEVPSVLEIAMKINEDPIVKKQKAEAEKLMRKVESWEYGEFDLIKEACQSHMERIDRKLAEIICNNDSFWYVRNIAYYAYVNYPKLNTNSVRLLCFDPPDSYQVSKPLISNSVSSTTLKKSDEAF